ncbi:MAG: M50 family metallopeptidase, partial [Deltaproteobacteria bacterium]
MIWILLMEALLILSTRLGAFLHEFMGHGLAALLFGGKFESFSLTLFAGGEARFSGDFGEIGLLCVSLGGIAVNLVTGLAALRFIEKYRSSFALTLFGLVFAGASVLSQLQYLILGSYYRHGDPASLIPYPAAMGLAWSGGLLALALCSLYVMR